MYMDGAIPPVSLILPRSLQNVNCVKFAALLNDTNTLQLKNWAISILPWTSTSIHKAFTKCIGSFNIIVCFTMIVNYGMSTITCLFYNICVETLTLLDRSYFQSDHHCFPPICNASVAKN